MSVSKISEMTRSLDSLDRIVDEHERAASRRLTVETPFKRDADRDYDGQREDSHYLTSTSGARDEVPDDADW